MKNEEYERLLSPTPGELLIMFLEGLAALLWRIWRLQPTETICRILGHGYYPDASRLPEWDWKPGDDAASREILDVVDTAEGEQVIGAFVKTPGGDLQYAGAPEREKKIAYKAELTPEEWEAMKNHTPPLLNRDLAKTVKFHLQTGASDYEAGILSGCSQSYARHHRLAFQKAAKNSQKQSIKAF